ncbi:unnamed protein product [Hymenolepis diminuta]|uniref:BTB domain-containing protein n=1 Tax=Hymenolepis diminuta TaxID=6216 RepID=A0A564YNI7_HYMDI|nr:unnamed protein product [Hymenolepis diminuta]
MRVRREGLDIFINTKEGDEVSAHRIVLSASFPVFGKYLSGNDIVHVRLSRFPHESSNSSSIAKFGIRSRQRLFKTMWSYLKNSPHISLDIGSYMDRTSTFIIQYTSMQQKSGEGPSFGDPSPPKTFINSYHMRQSHPFCSIPLFNSNVSIEIEPVVNVAAAPTTPPAYNLRNPYIRFHQRAAVIGHFASQEKDFQELLSQEDVGNRIPQFLRHMRSLSNETKVDDVKLSLLWVKRFPVNMATCLATYVNGSNLDELAESADKIQELGGLACVHAMLLHSSLMSRLNRCRNWIWST